MRCPTLSELPPPPPGKTGWPWTEESSPCEPSVTDGREWPRISIVTPSFNQGQFIEATLRSVLLQGYPNLEYLVLDGRSTDNSVEVINKYSPWLTYWASEPDSGQSDAINRGLKRASGTFATWINSDDMLCRSALRNHALRIGFEKKTVYVGNCYYLDESGNTISSHCGRVHSLEDLVRIRTVWRAGAQIIQPEVLFPLELALEVGGLNTGNYYSMDFELWGEFFLAGATFEYTNVDFGMFRTHAAQKTQDGLGRTQSLVDAAERLVARAHFLSHETKNEILADLGAYAKAYPTQYWRSSGRLARIGLPRGIVLRLRSLAAAFQKRARSWPAKRANGSGACL